MHVLLVNDDGPLDDKTCPYIKYLVDEINRNTDWKLSIVVPNQQRSWIGKAHFAGKTLTTTYLYTQDSTSSYNETVNEFKGPFAEPQSQLKPDWQEWALVDSTPAACTDIGINHLCKEAGDIDLVLSGPNFGKNSSNLYILASGTVGSAMEAVLHDKKAIALSYSYSSINHTFEEIKGASTKAVKLIDHLYKNWGTDNKEIELYTINVPLNPHIDNANIYYAPIMENRWGHSIYEPIPNTHSQFKWNPNFKKVYDDGMVDFNHTDSRSLINNDITVTPLKAKFKEVEPLFGQITLEDKKVSQIPNYLLLDLSKEVYIYEPIKQAFVSKGFEVTEDRSILSKIPQVKVFHYAEYEDLDLDLIQQFPNNYFIPSNIYRKGLIRKNYLSNLIHQFTVKNPSSILCTSFPLTHLFELDYAEFLDDALDEFYELREDVDQGDKTWILKPSMSDKGQGIRIFKTIDQLQVIFNLFEEDESDDDEEEEEEKEEKEDNGVITSQLRHFIVQEYQLNPILLKEYENKKFHIRTYVVANGDLQVYVYKPMLALFASEPYPECVEGEDAIAMAGHLTNTCLQGEEPIIENFWNLKGINQFEKQIIYNKICQITNQVFKAAKTIDRINFQPLPNATEFFGVDFLINQDLGVNLLEINAYPDFKQTGDDLKSLIYNLFESTIDEVIVANMSGETRVPRESLLTEVLNEKSAY